MSTGSTPSRTALVTGGAGGIGAACARALAATGHRVTVADIDLEAATRIAEEIGGKAWGLDLSDTAALEELELDTDVLVNNAGIQVVGPIETFDPEAFRRIHRLMLEAPFLLVRAALPAMYARGFGRVVNVSSVHGLRASRHKVAYVAAKHGLEGLSKVTALEGGEHGVTSNCVNPAYVRTALVDRQVAAQAKENGIAESEVLERIFLARSAVKRLVEPEEVGSLVAWLASDSAGMVSGSSYSMDGGFTA